MQKNDMAEKAKILIDGEELPGLVSIGEISLEKGTIEVPEFGFIRVIQNGIKKVNAIEAVFKIQRDSRTLTVLRNWFFNDEVHDVQKIRTDATGAEFARTLLPDVESILYKEPAFDGANVTYAQMPVLFLPWNVVPVDSQ